MSCIWVGFHTSTITAILEPDVDGTLHLPIPAEMSSSKVKVTATLESVGRRPSRAEALEALRSLARLQGGQRDRGSSRLAA